MYVYFFLLLLLLVFDGTHRRPTPAIQLLALEILYWTPESMMGIFHLVSWWMFFFWIDSARQRSDSWGGWAYESFCNVGLWVPVWSLESWDLRWRLSWFLMDFRMFCLHLGLARIPKFHERKGLCDSSLFFSYHWDPLSLLWFVLLHCCF